MISQCTVYVDVRISTEFTVYGHLQLYLYPYLYIYIYICIHVLSYSITSCHFVSYYIDLYCIYCVVWDLYCIVLYRIVLYIGLLLLWAPTEVSIQDPWPLAHHTSVE